MGLENKEARILLYDIETSPSLGYVWGKYDQNVIEFKQEWEILSFAWKWYGEKQVSVLSQRTTKTEESLVTTLRYVMSQADITIAHNGNQFDNRKSAAKFVEYGLKPLPRIPSVDTKLVAKNRFMFNSNSLNDLGKLLKLGEKVPTGGFQLWIDCMAGKKEAWLKMENYNKQDVVLLEKVYDRLRPWMHNHPNVALLEGKKGCPTCGSTKVVKRGIRANHAGLRQQMLCQSCKGWYLVPYKKAK